MKKPFQINFYDVSRQTRYGADFKTRTFSLYFDDVFEAISFAEGLKKKDEAYFEIIDLSKNK